MPDVFTKAVLTKYIDDRSYVIITDDGKVVYEETSANGFPRNMDSPKVFKLSFWGANIACHDVIPWGEDMSLLVIGCISRNPLTADNTLWLQIVTRKDFTAGNLTSYKLTADSDFRVFNKLSLLEVWGNPAKGASIPYLVVHDQGKSHYIPPTPEKDNVKDIARDNTRFLLFDVVENELTYLNEYYVDGGDVTPFT
jgi:hypothetical protein